MATLEFTERVSVSIAAKAIGCHIFTVHKMIAKGHLEAVKLPNGHWRIGKDSLERYLNGGATNEKT